MASYTEAFQELVSEYIDKDIDFPNLKKITVAQWILEGGRGQSRLAREFNNYAGLKYRPEMQGFATSVVYQASDGQDTYCYFETPLKFILGYWHFLDRPVYSGWRDHAESAEEFIRFIGNAYSTTGLYAEKVISFQSEAQALIDSLSKNTDFSEAKSVGTSEPPKPPIKDFIQSPNFSSRNEERIRRMILHYTTSRNVAGTIAWFKNPASRVSAHYVIARDGTIFQLVRDADKAWHAKNANADSIGIEHSAAKGDTMT